MSASEKPEPGLQGVFDDCGAQQKRPGVCPIEVLEGFGIALFI